MKTKVVKKECPFHSDIKFKVTSLGLSVIFLLGTSSMNSKLTGSGVAAAAAVKKKIIVIFTYKQRLLSIDMKTKVVQHVKSE